MSTSAIASSSLVCVGASLTGAPVAALEFGVADGAFAEFLSSLVGVGTESSTAAVEAGTCTEPDSETVDSGEILAASDPDSDEPEDTSSQQIVQFLISVAQPVPQAPVVGSPSAESVKDEPAREVASEVNVVSTADGGDSAGTLPDFPIECAEVAVDTKKKTEALFSEDLDFAERVVKTDATASRAVAPVIARECDAQAEQVVDGSTPAKYIAPERSSDRNSQNVQPVFQPVVAGNSVTLKANERPVARNRNENPGAPAAIRDAGVKNIESEASNSAIKERVPAQQNAEKHVEALSEHTALIEPHTRPSQLATGDSGEPETSAMKVSPHSTREMVPSRSASSAQEMKVALNTDMGKVHIRAELGKDDRLSAVVQADHKETGAILAEHAPVLQRALAEKDILLGSFQVTDGTAKFGQSPNHSTPHRQQFEKFSIATSRGSEAATCEQESYEPEKRKLSVRV